MMNDTQTADPFREVGKSFDWRPITSPDLRFEPVAEDARPEMQQVAHFAMLCVVMRASLDETNDIIQALQHCERAHSLVRIAIALPVVVAAIENAVALMPTTVTQLGLQNGLATPGLFIGALVEELAQISAEACRFPCKRGRERPRSPRVEFEDCLAGARVARRLGLLDELRPAVSQPYSRLVTAFRNRLGREGVLLVEETAQHAGETAGVGANNAGADNAHAAQHFMRDIGEAARIRSAPLPAHWRSYARALEAGTTVTANERVRG